MGRSEPFSIPTSRKKVNSGVIQLPPNTCFSSLVSGPVSYQGYEVRVAPASSSYSGPQLHHRNIGLQDFYSILITIIIHIFLLKDNGRYHVSFDRMHQ